MGIFFFLVFGIHLFPGKVSISKYYGFSRVIKGIAGFASIERDKIKIFGVHEIRHDEIRAVIIKKAPLFGYSHMTYYEKNGVLLLVEFNTLFKKYVLPDSSKVLVLPGTAPDLVERSVLRKYHGVTLSGVLGLSGKGSSLKRILQHYLGNNGADISGQKIIFNARGGGSVVDCRYFNELKNLLKGKKTMLDLSTDDFIKLPYISYGTYPFFEINIIENGDLYISFVGGSYCIRRQFMKKILIRGRSISFVHKDPGFLERFSFFCMSHSVIAKIKEIYPDLIDA